jgi:hypothetical protein
MRDNARNMDQTFRERAQNFQSLNAVENMQSYANIAQRHAQDVQRLVPGFQKLYNSLSDEQRRTAEQVFQSYPGNTQRAPEGVSEKRSLSQSNHFSALSGMTVSSSDSRHMPAIKPSGADEHRHERGPAGGQPPDGAPANGTAHSSMTHNAG